MLVVVEGRIAINSFVDEHRCGWMDNISRIYLASWGGNHLKRRNVISLFLRVGTKKKNYS